MEKFKPHTYSGEQPAERPDLRRANQESAHPLQLHTENTPKAKEAVAHTREVLDTIDQDTLFDIFREYYGRVGNDPDTLALSDVSEIEIFYDWDSKHVGGYTQNRPPMLNAAWLSVLGDDQILNTLIHEYAHEGSTAITCEYNPDDAVYVEQKVTGVQRESRFVSVDSVNDEIQHISDVTISDSSINEGITQIVANDIHTEYVRRVGEGGNEPGQRIREETSFEPYMYFANQLNARVYIVFLSLAADIPEDDVKNAVVRTYFRNGEIVPAEFNDLVISLEEEKGLPFEELIARILKMPSTLSLKEGINSEEDALWREEFRGVLPDDKRVVFKQKVKSLLENYFAAQDMAYEIEKSRV